MNEGIRKKKDFKNPSIYEKLIERYEINEYGSNFAEVRIIYLLFNYLRLFKNKFFLNALLKNIDDLKSQGYMDYNELDQAQRAEWAKKEKERKERSKIQMVSAVKKT